MINELGTMQAGTTLSDLCHREPALQVQVQHGSRRALGAQKATRQKELSVRFPFQIRLCRGCQGRPDLQLHLLQISSGQDDANLAAYGDSLTRTQGAANTANRAASLIFLQLTFPALVQRAGPYAALAGCSLVASTLTEHAFRQTYPALARRAGRRYATFRARCRRRMGQHRSRVQGAAETAGQVGRWVEHQVCHPAAALALGTMLWAVVHPASFHIVKCLAAAIPVQAGYASTVRQTARGQLTQGAGMEEAWQRRHRWAARKLAPLQTDLYDSPPLAPVYSLIETLSLGIAVALSPAAGSTLDLWGSIAAGGRVDKPPAQPLPEVKAAAEGKLQTGAAPVQIAGNPAITDGTTASQVQPSRVAAGSESPTARNRALQQAGLRPERKRFVPDAYEEFETSRLPTIRSRSELEAVAASGEFAVPINGSHGAVSPFEAAAARPLEEDEPARPAQDGALVLVPFSSAELEALDAHRPPMDEEGLDLYGRADHLQKTPAPLTAAGRLQMATRALYLLLVFLPFLLLGPLLLYLGYLTAKPSHTSGKRRAIKGGAPEPSGAAQRSQAGAEEQAEKAPAQLGASSIQQHSAHEPAVPVSKRLRLAAWHLLLVGIRAGGAAFIKWGQWSATREDMFPAEFCSVLAELHDKAPEHSWRASKREIEAVFGKSVEELFESIDYNALASGSIAQVHKAIMRVNGKPRSVVVKVRHPKVAERLYDDFRLLIPLAGFTAQVRSLKGLNLKSSLEQFSATMTAQTDLRVETAHLRRFFRNFAAIRSSITPPFPLPGFETASVLIETFEPGRSVARYIANPAPFNTQIVALGVDAYLKMLLQDNFVHTDLHPGNILVRPRAAQQAARTPAQERELLGDIPHDSDQPLQLVLLDFGLAEELNFTVRKHFISLLNMIGKGDGRRAAYHMLHMGKIQTCPNPQAFVEGMISLFKQIANIKSPHGIDLDQVMKAILGLARQHEVVVDSSYAALVVGVCVIVGFATSLDPGVNLMDAATPALLMHNLTGHIIGQLYA